MNDQETVLELRRIEKEIMSHEKALADLTRKRREVLELTASRPDRRKLVSLEGQRRLLEQACSRSQ